MNELSGIWLNYTAQERTDRFLNNSLWSLNDVRLLIRDCEKLEKELVYQNNNIEFAKSEIAK